MIWYKLKLLMMNRSFFTKLFLTISFVSVLGIVTISLLYQHYYRSVLLNLELEQTRNSVAQSTLNLDHYLDQIVKDMFQFITYSGNGVFLLEAQTSSSQLTEDMKQAADMLSAFRHRYGGDITSSFFFKPDVFFMDYDLRFIPGVDYRDQQWYRYFQDQSREMWLPPSTEILFTREQPLPAVQIAMGMYDISGQDGIFVVRLSPFMFEEAFRHLASPHLRISLLDAQGHIIYASDPGEGEHKQEWISYSSVLEKSGFSLQVSLDKAAIYEKAVQSRNLNRFAILSVLLASFILAGILSLTLIRPLRRLQTLMKRVEVGDFEVQMPVLYKDEIGRLGRGFNKMTNRLSELIQQVYVFKMEKLEAELKQKEATIKALQSQINPHFLYNTLEAINCHAIIHDIPSISNMSRALADFFRYSTEGHEALVPLIEEIEHARVYIDIQLERYPEIDVRVDLPERLKYCSVVKLSLQPLIENAFMHAFQGERSYWLNIRVEASGEDCLLYVEDNGEGMEAKERERFNRLFRRGSPLGAELSVPAQGIGLLNVHQRIRLYFGAPYGLELQPSAAGGLRILLRVPRKTKIISHDTGENPDESDDRG
ncbi:sensor histidine kinase [Paenibacillus sp. 1P07SE]|uniref:sensor histidine kinase n=1 Tax=Paenibacillus sp. 1P07SE TaxID=3132209 RepID=UPI0039A61FA8